MEECRIEFSHVCYAALSDSNISLLHLTSSGLLTMQEREWVQNWSTKSSTSSPSVVLCRGFELFYREYVKSFGVDSFLCMLRDANSLGMTFVQLVLSLRWRSGGPTCSLEVDEISILRLR